MRLYAYLCSIAFIFSLILVAKPISAASLDIPLTIRNSTSVSRHHTAITSGVVLPRSANITTAQQLQVVDNTGKIVPTQFTVLARWGGEVKDNTKPIKWVLLDLVAKKARSKSPITYRLQTGSDNKVPAQVVKIKRHNDKHSLTVRTGAATFVLNTKNFNLFQQVYLEPKHTPLLADTNQLGAVVSANGQTYTAGNGAIQTFKVEQRGPVHSIVLVKGWQTNAAGDKVLAYTARLHFYAGQSYVKVQYGVWNDNVMLNVNGQPDIKEFGSPHTVLFSDLTLTTQLAQQGSWSYLIGGANKKYWSGTLTTDQAQLYQDSSGGPAWHDDFGSKDTTFRGFKALANQQTLHGACDDTTPAKQCRASGWLDLTSDRGGLAVGVRDFWQNFPKNLVAKTDGTIGVKLFPDDYSTDFELRVGERKTHEVLYYFHAADYDAKQVAHRMFDLHHPLMITASAEWYLDSGAFQDSVPYDAKHFSAYEGYNDAAIMYKDANLFLLEDGIPGTGWLYGDRPESLGWRNYGDRIAEDETSPDNYPVFTNQQYDHAWWFVYQFIRTLDTGAKRPNLWWQLAQPSVWHQSDVDIVHSRCTGKSDDIMRTCMDPSNPYIIGWAMGGRLTNQWHAWAVPDIHRNALIDSWAGGFRGMLYYWYLTGDPVAKDGWRESMHHAYWEANNSPCNTDPTSSCGPGYAVFNPRLDGWTRDSAYSIEMLTDAGLATGQERYFAAAHDNILTMDPTGVWFADENFKLDINAAQTGQALGPWTLAMVIKSLGYYQDAYQEHYGTVDSEAQSILLHYATIASRLWQLNADEPSQYYIYETGGYVPESNNPMQVALADGLAWALKYDNGTLDRNRVAAVAEEAFNHGSHPWGGYDENTYTSTKTHVMMGVNGWRYMKYKLTQ